MKMFLPVNPLSVIRHRAIKATAFAAAVMLLAAAACGSDDQSPSRGVAAQPTPDARATITALARTGNVGLPTPTAVPAADRAVAVEFSAGHEDISLRWDAFHAEFDVWRQGLTQCTPGAAQSALSNFAGDFARITESARELPRPMVIRNLADDLIKAAEGEAAALRMLRDTWQPGDTSNNSSAAVATEGDTEASEGSSADSNPVDMVSPFESLAVARSQSALLRRSVADALLDRSGRTDAAAQTEIDAFSEILEELELAWDKFHVDYDELRTEVVGLTSGEAASLLGATLARFTDIVSSVRALPDGGATSGIAQILSNAAQEEERGLRRLRSAIQNGGASTVEEAAQESNGDANGEEETDTPAGNSEAVVDTSAYDAFDSQIAVSNAARVEARRILTLAKLDIDSETKLLVAEFTSQYDSLTQAWNSFHKSYDDWRKTDGGCNRSQVVQELGKFGVTIGEIAKDARNLPAATVLRPMGELLVEAAEREVRALRDLGNLWEPYNTGVYTTLDQETTTANRLRRQVAVGLQELSERFGISP
ncbi:MAG: hypothetical protein BZY75_01515 [SAR202 cluster bacterium Io17-Chloro-G7]|nr:MAG: hypothetical protein BZY75_01515 [SAR202 cluster bacterium Io17-Chloro-G7]